MNKFVTTLFLSLLILIMTAVGYLGWQLFEIKNNAVSQNISTPNHTTTAKDTLGKTDSLKQTLEEQNATIQSLSSKVASLTNKINELNQGQYMPAPEYVLNEKAFEVVEEVKNNIFVTGYENTINNWENRNEFYLEYLLSKILPFEFNRSKNAIEVKDIVDNSLFHQMGLRSGDLILRVDGQRFVRGMDLRYKLLEQKNKQILIQRDKKQQVITVNYSDKKTPSPDTTTLAITRTEFQNYLNELTADVTLTPIYDEGQMIGVRLNNTANSPLFSLMSLKPEDVITKVNDRTITNKTLLNELQAIEGNLEISYLRNDQPEKAVIAFQE